MKKVVDSSALRSKILADYLSTSPRNIAVITEHLAMEAFKGNGQTNIRHSLRTLSTFPEQIIVLKSTADIVMMRPRKTGLQSRLVDDRETKGFLKYCRVLYSDSWTSAEASTDRQRKQLLANRRYDLLSGDVEIVRRAIQNLKSSYSAVELKALRRGKSAPGDFWNRFFDDVLNGTLDFYGEIPNRPYVTCEGMLFSYPFRYCLCAYARAVDWIAEGGYDTAPSAKLTNDYTDMAYAAYATFYDGILTEDKKLKEIHDFAAGLWNRVFAKVGESLRTSHHYPDTAS